MQIPQELQALHLKHVSIHTNYTEFRNKVIVRYGALNPILLELPATGRIWNLDKWIEVHGNEAATAISNYIEYLELHLEYFSKQNPNIL